MSRYEEESLPLLVGDGTKAPPPKGKSPAVAYIFTVAFIIGSGVLGVPYAFTQAGLLLSVLFMVLITAMAFLTFYWEIEVMDRAEGVTQAREAGMGTPNSHRSSTIGINSSEPRLEISPDRVFELNKLCETFYGQVMRRIYEVSLLFYSIGGIMLYGSVFASSLVITIPIPGLSHTRECDVYAGKGLSTDCDYAYTVFVGVFLLYILFVTSREIKETVAIQFALQGFAWSVLAIMIITTIASLFRGPFNEHNVRGSGDHAPYIADHGVSLFEVSGFSKLFTTAVFAQCCQHGAPGLVHLLGDKRKARAVFASSFATTMTFYALLGVICGLYFGSGVKEVITINWIDYGSKQSGAASWFNNIISYLVVLYPIVTVGSAAPLLAVTVGNNIYPSVPESWKDRFGERVLRVACRWVATVPPLIAAMFVKKFDVIVGFTGLFGFGLAFIFPALLQWKSKRVCYQMFGEAGKRTSHTWHFSHDFYAFFILIAGAAAAIFSLVQLCQQLADGQLTIG